MGHSLSERGLLHVTEVHLAVGEDSRLRVRRDAEVVDEFGGERHQHRDVSPPIAGYLQAV